LSAQSEGGILIQVERMAGIMMSARQECSALLQQCYQQLYGLLGTVPEQTHITGPQTGHDSLAAPPPPKSVDSVEGTAEVTPEQTRSVAAALKGDSCLAQQD